MSRPRVLAAPSSSLRLWAAALLTVLLAGATVAATLAAVAPPPAPSSVHRGPPLAPALTRRLLLVIVDGLRYDVATDPAKMPHFAEEMRTRASGEIWAGPVSMTTSAVLSIGTGQRGRLEQVVRNVSAGRPPFDTWFSAAKEQGLRVGVVGDPAWVQMYGPDLAEDRLDPEGVAIDVDFNPITFRSARELLARSPDVLVFHFGTPDHQGHAYGIRSPRYAAHIHGFDEDLAALLREVGPDWTVVVTSDHGAADSGTHGSDTALQRRSPIYAYGPGIVPGQKLSHPADQLDLSATLPVLLGVSPPAHGLGHVLVEWLAVPETTRAALARGNAERVLQYARAVAEPARVDALRDGLARSGDGGARVDASERAVRGADALVAENTGLASGAAPLRLAGIAFIVLLLAIVLLPEASPWTFAGAASVLVVTVLLVIHVERLPGAWPNGVRIPLFVLGNVPFLALLVAPSRTSRLFTQLGRALPMLAPCALAGCYTADARPEAFVAAVVLALVFVGYGPLIPGGGTLLRGAGPRLSSLDRVAFFAAIALLVPTVLREGDTYSALFGSTALRDALATAVAALGAAWLVRPHVRSLGTVLVVALAAGGVLWVRPVLGPVVGRTLWLGLVASAVFLFRKRRAGEGIVALLFAVALVSRQFESIPVVASVVLATVVGRSLGKAEAPAAGARLATTLVLSTFLFGLGFTYRIGVQDGLDFGGMFWGAGAFNDAHVSAYVIGAALSFKYAAGIFLPGAALLPAWGEGRLPAFPRVVLAVLAYRVLSLFAQFTLAGTSYWTAMRVIGDLPTAVAACVGGLALVLAYRTFALGTAGIPQAPGRPSASPPAQ
ncbi:MAG TPA: alkaline phosphatase family protein [Polyangiaceae bacterium]|nr:alkaline phosphatase family protein [Polyangiaceae bacterium]